jgi:uncharacterized membrane protein
MERAERLPVIDFTRGVVMVLMALDHVRTFFAVYEFPPEDMAHTWMALFLTRWVTHFCAPLFFLLAGTSAYLSRRGPGHLWRRGLWLVVLELTVIGFAWSFVPGSSFAGVIWCLGWSMIVLSLFVRLPRWVTMTFALGVIALHDLSDTISPKTFGSFEWLWRILHVSGVAVLPGGIHYFVLFPIVPWVAVMALGYAIGPWFKLTREERTRILVVTGTIATVLFIVLRLTNVYGNPATSFMHGGPGLFRPYPTSELTIIAFLNTEKYPPSLDYLLMTLGPSLLLMAFVENLFARSETALTIAKPVIVFGRVPFFFYVLHLYVIHLAAVLAHRQFELGGVWVVFIVIVVALYFPCRWFADYKRQSTKWWLSYV